MTANALGFISDEKKRYNEWHINHKHAGNIDLIAFAIGANNTKSSA